MARCISESNSSSISSSFCLMEKQHCTAFSITLQSQKNAKPKVDSRSKRRNKNKLFCIYFLCFVGVFLELEIHCEDCKIRERPGSFSCTKLSGPEPLEKASWHLHTGMANGSWGWRAEQGHRESSSAMPVSCCLARRGLRAAHLLHDSERFQGRRCAFFCRKSEDTKGDAFATSAVGRSCVLCYFGIVFD